MFSDVGLVSLFIVVGLVVVGGPLGLVSMLGLLGLMGNGHGGSGGFCGSGGFVGLVRLVCFDFVPMHKTGSYNLVK